MSTHVVILIEKIIDSSHLLTLMKPKIGEEKKTVPRLNVKSANLKFA